MRGVATASIGGSVGSPFLESGIDFERANAARMYDFCLGGAHNFAVDRERVEQVIAVQPNMVAMCRANRDFLGRVVAWCARRGLTQFLDLGSGVPTVGNVHEIARRHAPDARVAYVDFEPVAVAHATEIIAEQGLGSAVTVTRADLRDADAVLSAPGVAGLLDLERPVVVLAVAVLHFVEGDVASLLAPYREVLAPGSVVAISHGSDDQPDPAVGAQMREVRAVYAGSATPVTWRDRTELRRAFHGLEIVGTGPVDVNEWPDGRVADAPSWTYGLVGVVT